MRALLVLAAVVTLAVPAAGAAPGTFFRTPSGNIYCAYFGSLRCDIRSGLKPKPARPAGCDFDWGQTLVLSRSGRTSVGCVSDSVLDPSARVLPYGTRWRRGGLTCVSKRTALFCFNPQSHGFSMSRSRSYRF